MPTESRTSARRLLAAERQKLAFEMRKLGATYDQIAQALGYRGKQAAEYSVKAWLRHLYRESAEESKLLDLERLDLIIFHMFQRVRQGDERAAQALMHAMERRARMLGYDEPIRIDHSYVQREAQRIAAERGITVEEVLREAEAIVRGE